MKHKCPSPRIGKKPRGNIGRWLYAAFLTATLSASLCQLASAATVWEKANEIMRDVYINQMLSAVKEVPPKYIILVEQPEQIAEIHTPNTSGYCTVSSGGEVQYYQIE